MRHQISLINSLMGNVATNSNEKWGLFHNNKTVIACVPSLTNLDFYSMSKYTTIDNNSHNLSQEGISYQGKCYQVNYQDQFVGRENFPPLYLLKTK